MRLVAHAPTPGLFAFRGVLAPFANGGLDIRSRALADRGVACAQVWDYLRGYNASNASYLASCDGLQGYFFARCLATPRLDAPPTSVGTALHLPWPKYHPPSRGSGARAHSSVMHPDKHCLHGGAWYRSAADAAANCEPSVPGWKWNQGQALLPFPFDLGLSLRPRDGSAVLGWTSWNLTAIRRYRALHADRARADERYCDELPCTRPYTSSAFQQSLLARLRATAGPVATRVRSRQQPPREAARHTRLSQAAGARAAGTRAQVQLAAAAPDQAAEVLAWRRAAEAQGVRRARKAAEDAAAAALVQSPVQDTATLELLRAARRALEAR